MAIGKTQNIYNVEGKLVCDDCLENAERDALAPEDVVSVHPGAEVIVFICSRCKKRI